MKGQRNRATESEQMFETYLRSVGVNDFEFEKSFAGTTRRPDYAISWRGVDTLFEVREFQVQPSDLVPGFGYFEPYEPIREKIGAARKKFKELKEYCCCLVLYNCNKPRILGTDPLAGPTGTATGRGTLHCLHEGDRGQDDLREAERSGV